MTYYVCGASVLFGLESDHYPTDAEVMAEANRRITPGSPSYGLHISQMAWAGTAPVPLEPPVPPVPPPVTVKRWRVLYQAAIRVAPISSAAVLTYAEVGEVLDQIDDVQPPDWLHVKRGTVTGYVLRKQVTTA
jgi:hypothetical protein